VLALTATACGGEVTTDASPPPSGEGTTYSVGVDGSTDEFPGSFTSFFPDRLTVHPGDTVVFRRPENGEPHTVTLGTSVSSGITITGEGFFEGGFGGPPRRDNSMPCFLAEGIPPGEGCPPDQQEPVPFDGTQSWFNSGGLLGEEEFTLDLAGDIAPGEYTYVCLVHTPLMEGTIDVVEPDQPADDPEDVTVRGSEELEREIALVRPRVETGPSLHEGQVAVSVPNPIHPTTAWATVFHPEEIEILVGGTATWRVMGSHTISFNAPESARPFFERAEDGSVRVNEEAAEPRAFDEWDGTGFLNSGLRSGFDPPDEFSVTFTGPGTYSYQCLVHFGMEGRVEVTEL
jgi:plastocyanin